MRIVPPCESPLWIIAGAQLWPSPAPRSRREGHPDAGKAEGGGRRLLRLPWRRRRRHRDGLADDKNVPNLAAQPDLYIAVPARLLPQGRAQERTDDADRRDAQRRRHPQPRRRISPRCRRPTAAAPDAAPAGHRARAARSRRRFIARNAMATTSTAWTTSARLAGQREDYLYKALRDFKSGARRRTGAAGMAEVVYPLGDLEMKALAHYMSRLH